MNYYCIAEDEYVCISGLRCITHHGKIEIFTSDKSADTSEATLMKTAIEIDDRTITINTHGTVRNESSLLFALLTSKVILPSERPTAKLILRCYV